MRWVSKCARRKSIQVSGKRKKEKVFEKHRKEKESINGVSQYICCYGNGRGIKVVKKGRVSNSNFISFSKYIIDPPPQHFEKRAKVYGVEEGVS